MIAGGGVAADAAAVALREAGHLGPILILAGEAELPYQRPPLSKRYLLGELERPALALRAAAQYRERGIEVRLGARALEIDTKSRRLLVESGEKPAYDLLLIATGAGPRRLPELEQALYLRSVEDADRLGKEIRDGHRLHVLGAGFVGSEVAWTASRLGAQVVLQEALPAPLVRVLGEGLGGWLGGVIRSHGVELRTGVLELPQGRPLLVAVGSEPNTDLAERAGLLVDRGVLVDERGRTSVEGVFAAGDVARFMSPRLGGHVRVEHFQTAASHGAFVGRSMAGIEQAFTEVPWFWSEQFGLTLQYAGAGAPFDEVVVRGEVGRPPFAAFQLQAGRLVGVLGVDDHRSVARGRRLIGAGISPSRAELADPGFDLRLGAPA